MTPGARVLSAPREWPKAHLVLDEHARPLREQFHDGFQRKASLLGAAAPHVELAAGGEDAGIDMKTSR